MLDFNSHGGVKLIKYPISDNFKSLECMNSNFGFYVPELL